MYRDKGDLGPYRPRQIHPRDQQILDELTRPRIWNWQRFRQVLIDLSILGPGNYVPSPNRPESISLQGLGQTVAELQSLSEAKGRETSKVVFGDRERKALVVSGKTAIGSESQVVLAIETEVGREKVQQRAVTIHTHPIVDTANGLSDVDYLTFISDPEQIAMIMAYEGGIIMALKTTVTPNAMRQEDVSRRLADIRHDYFDQSGSSPLLKVVELNKAICAEFGLTLYTAPKGSDTVRRVEVTK